MHIGAACFMYYSKLLEALEAFFSVLLSILKGFPTEYSPQGRESIMLLGFYSVFYHYTGKGWSGNLDCKFCLLSLKWFKLFSYEGAFSFLSQ